MAGPKWLPFDTLVKIVLARSKDISIGRAEGTVRKALASGDVREQPSLIYDDGLFTNRRPGPKNYYSVGDFLDWLKLNPPQTEPVTTQPKRGVSPRKRAAKPTKQPKQDIIKGALKGLFPSDGKTELPTNILMMRVKVWLTDHGYGDVPVTRDTLARARGRRK
jgi:hypothetical protein